MAGVVQPDRPRSRLDPGTRRQQILEAAAALLAGRDPAHVTFEEIAVAAGVSRSLVHNYFGDRRGLVAAVYLHSFDMLDEELDAKVDPDLTPRRRMAAVVQTYLHFAAAHPAQWRLIGTLGATLHPDVQSARNRRFERISAAWGGGALGRSIARGVIGLLEAVALDWLDHQDSDLDELVKVTTALLWSGLPGLAPWGITPPARGIQRRPPRAG